MQKEIEQAEKEADITIVMPQMGVEDQLNQRKNRRVISEMVDWEQTLFLEDILMWLNQLKIIEKDGQKKLIIYSMEIFCLISV